MYRRLVLVWGAVFALVGLAFLLAPERTAHLLTAIAHAVGLRGEIRMSGGLDHALALSLMSCITALSLLSAREPAAAAPYVALMTAKLASTATFLAMSWSAPAWLICAAGDGFVAFTLWAARPCRTLVERWLESAGADPALANVARDRVRRYPLAMRAAWPLAVAAIDWCGPAALLRRASRARALDAGDFDRFLAALRARPLTRLVSTFALAPLMEAAAPETAPVAPPHPLDGRLLRSARDDFDVVVIGSGAGGAPLARELSRRGKRVAIVEKGGLVRPDAAPRAIERHYASQGMTPAGRVLVLAGSAVGGTTPVNSGTCLRPLRECTDAWGPAFRDLDRWVDAAWSACRVTVPERSLLSASAGLFERGLRAIGRDGAYVLPRNAPACRGSGRCCFGCPAGAKHSTDVAFLPGALDAGAEILHATTARGIVETADGVRIDIGERVLRARELVVSAGALFTPRLLGRGGTHLKVHPATKIFAHFPGLRHGERGVPQGLGYRPPELPRVTFEGIHTPRSVAGPMIAAAGERWRWWMDRLDEVASFGLMVRDRGTGRLGRIAMDYALDPADARDIGEGLILLARIFFAAGADRVLLPVGGMPCEITSVDGLAPGDFTPERLMLCGFHPQGTAGVGRVVDDELRLIGSRRISVCDASVLPDSPGVNPQITIMALSLRLAERLAASV